MTPQERNGYDWVSNHERKAMRDMRTAGASISEIWAAFPSRSQNTIWRHVYDVPPPPGGWKASGPRRRFDYDKAIRLRAEGFTYKVIAERFGVSQGVICRVVKRAIERDRRAA